MVFLQRQTLLAVALLATSGSAFAQSNWSMSFHNDAGTWRPAVGLCETAQYNAIVFRGAQTLGPGAQPVGDDPLPAYRGYDKANPAVGLRLDGEQPEDCGAGTCYFPFANGATQYLYRRSNVSGNPLPNAALRVSNPDKVLLDESCRNPAGTTFVCFTDAKRNVYITKNSATGRYSYLAYNAGTATPFVLNNGTRSNEGTGFVKYSFANGAYKYELIYARVKLAEYQPYAEITVTKGTTLVARNLCQSYTFGSE